jgi:hypothetical protein
MFKLSLVIISVILSSCWYFQNTLYSPSESIQQSKNNKLFICEYHLQPEPDNDSIVIEQAWMERGSRTETNGMSSDVYPEDYCQLVMKIKQLPNSPVRLDNYPTWSLVDPSGKHPIGISSTIMNGSAIGVYYCTMTECEPPRSFIFNLYRKEFEKRTFERSLIFLKD